MITIIDIHPDGHATVHEEEAPALDLDCVIHLKTGVPPLNTPAFDQYLRDWHAEHDGQVIPIVADLG